MKYTFPGGALNRNASQLDEKAEGYRSLSDASTLAVRQLA
jgi:hypothetical protein